MKKEILIAFLFTLLTCSIVADVLISCNDGYPDNSDLIGCLEQPDQAEIISRSTMDSPLLDSLASHWVHSEKALVIMTNTNDVIMCVEIYKNSIDTVSKSRLTTFILSELMGGGGYWSDTAKNLIILPDL